MPPEPRPGAQPRENAAPRPWTYRLKRSERNVLIPNRVHVRRVGGAMLVNEPPCPRGLAAGAAPLERHLLRSAGWIALTVALFLAADRAGWPIGTVEWFGMLTASAVSFVLLLTYTPPVGRRPGIGVTGLCPDGSLSGQRDDALRSEE